MIPMVYSNGKHKVRQAFLPFLKSLCPNGLEKRQKRPYTTYMAESAVTPPHTGVLARQENAALIPPRPLPFAACCEDCAFHAPMAGECHFATPSEAGTWPHVDGGAWCGQFASIHNE